MIWYSRVTKPVFLSSSVIVFDNILFLCSENISSESRQKTDILERGLWKPTVASNLINYNMNTFPQVQ